MLYITQSILSKDAPSMPFEGTSTVSHFQTVNGLLHFKNNISMVCLLSDHCSTFFLINQIDFYLI